MAFSFNDKQAITIHLDIIIEKTYRYIKKELYLLLSELRNIMTDYLKKEGKFEYVEAGQGSTIIVLHGLMGELSNFNDTFKYFSNKNYRVIIPKLPLHKLPLIKTNVKNFAKFLDEFMKFKKIDKAIILGNSLGGHIGLYFSKHFAKKTRALILTGSSGLYEKSMGDTFPKRGNYEYIEKKVRSVFFDPSTASKEMVNNVYSIVNDNSSVVKILAIAKNAIRHNMAKDLPKMKQPTCIIWGKQDTVTPPRVAEDFNKLLPNSELFWIEKCGHAAMMERPKEFNKILYNWLISNNL